jgi:hypothetical protein
MTAFTRGNEGALGLPKGMVVELMVPGAVPGIIMARITPILRYLLDFLTVSGLMASVGCRIMGRSGRR